MKFVIIDDEQHCINLLELILKKLDPENEVITTFQNPISALEQLESLNFDILFLDVEMPFLNGFQLLSKINNIRFSVIFTTAFNQYAITAFKYSAFDYLLKPISTDDLRMSLGRWQKAHVCMEEQVKYLSKVLKNDSPINKIMVATKSSIDLIYIEDILYCEAESNYTIFYLISNKKICASKTMREFEDILIKHHLTRIHKSYIINPKHIQKIHKGKDYYVELTNCDFLFPVSRNKHKDLHLILSQIKR